jgi:hypothetical protein
MAFRFRLAPKDRMSSKRRSGKKTITETMEKPRPEGLKFDMDNSSKREAQEHLRLSPEKIIPDEIEVHTAAVVGLQSTLLS